MKLLLLPVLLHVLPSVIFTLPIPIGENSICPKYHNFFGYELNHIGCCIDKIHCSVPIDLTSDARLEREIKEIQGPSRIRARRNKRSIASAYDKEKNLSKFYSLCRSTVSVITPVYATSAITHSQVQLLQVPPVMTQSIVVHTCDEQETPIIRGYCQQHFKRESVYVVIPSNYTSGEVSFHKEYILVGSGCNLALQIDMKYMEEAYLLEKPQKSPSYQEHEDIYKNKFDPVGAYNSSVYASPGLHHENKTPPPPYEPVAYESVQSPPVYASPVYESPAPAPPIPPSSPGYEENATPYYPVYENPTPAPYANSPEPYVAVHPPAPSETYPTPSPPPTYESQEYDYPSSSTPHPPSPAYNQPPHAHHSAPVHSSPKPYAPTAAPPAYVPASTPPVYSAPPSHAHHSAPVHVSPDPSDLTAAPPAYVPASSPPVYSAPPSHAHHSAPEHVSPDPYAPTAAPPAYVPAASPPVHSAPPPHAHHSAPVHASPEPYAQNAAPPPYVKPSSPPKIYSSPSPPAHSAPEHAPAPHQPHRHPPVVVSNHSYPMPGPKNATYPQAFYSGPDAPPHVHPSSSSTPEPYVEHSVPMYSHSILNKSKPPVMSYVNVPTAPPEEVPYPETVAPTPYDDTTAPPPYYEPSSSPVAPPSPAPYVYPQPMYETPPTPNPYESEAYATDTATDYPHEAETTNAPYPEPIYAEPDTYTATDYPYEAETTDTPYAETIYPEPDVYPEEYTTPEPIEYNAPDYAPTNNASSNSSNVPFPFGPYPGKPGGPPYGGNGELPPGYPFPPRGPFPPGYHYPRPEEMIYPPGMPEPGPYPPPGDHPRGNGGKPPRGPPRPYYGPPRGRRDEEVYIRGSQDTRYTDPKRTEGEHGDVAYGSPATGMYVPPHTIGMPVYSVKGNQDSIIGLMTAT